MECGWHFLFKVLVLTWKYKKKKLEIPPCGKKVILVTEFTILYRSTHFYLSKMNYKKMASARSNFKNIFSRPLFTIIFRAKNGKISPIFYFELVNESLIIAILSFKNYHFPNQLIRKTQLWPDWNFVKMQHCALFGKRQNSLEKKPQQVAMRLSP